MTRALRRAMGAQRPANGEMIAGYIDGTDPDCPEPNDNRSRSYRHGFMCARRDRNPDAPWVSADTLRAMADEAMAADEAAR